MIYVYVIQSVIRKYRYVGITNDFDRRLEQHNSGRSSATKGFAPFKKVLLEEYPDYIEARKREVFLKSGQGRQFLDSIE